MKLFYEVKKRLLVTFLFLFTVLNVSADETQSDNFSASLEGWTGNISRVDFSSSQRMRISQDGTATKTFTFATPDYANANVTISFNMRLDDDWENDDDVYVSANGTQIAHYNHTDGSYNKTLSATTNASGQLELAISTDTSSSSEYAYIDDISVTAIGPVAPTFAISSAALFEGNSGIKDMNFTVTLSISANATVNFATTAGTATAQNDYNTTSGTLTFTAGGATSQTVSVPIIGDTGVEPNETFTITLSNPTGGTVIGTASAIGTIQNDDSYCESKGLSTGFHIIDPDGGAATNSFEIFCSADFPKKALIALPNKNNSNNFIFNSDVLGSTNYYTQATSNATHFDAIEIDPLTMEVITSGTLNPTNAGSYKVLGKGFSNINLLGTPFAIDWTNTTVSGCDTTKLTRKGYHDQAVKINALDYNNKARCQIDSMKLKLLSDYTYLVYEGTEVLEKTCKEMAEAVPTDFLDSSTVKGHYWISPNDNSRTHNATTITAMDRPIVAYCWYQTDLDYVWTFFLAMDGKVTNTKDDLVNKEDTCSEKGLWPFVPNNEDTFERVRTFLYDNKAEWDKYTGTVNEKLKTFANQDYYLASEQNVPIWPYGSFGVYFPQYGDRDANGVSKEWGDSTGTYHDYDVGWLSGSPMHNISTIMEDYPRKNNDSGDTARDYYSWGNYSNTDTLSGGNYVYADTMGAKGWRSVLADLGKTDEWFISRTGAGDNFRNAGSNTTSYYEPNGNYTANAWLNFLYDDQGRVRHLDDLDDKYPYYDYMCMAEDNYDFTVRYALVKGPFNVVEHNAVLSGTQYKDANLTTKIVNQTMPFDVVLLTNDLSNIRSDYDLSAGIFLNDTTMVGTTETARNIWYFGQISDFNATRFEIPASRWPSGVETWPKASKRLFFEFKYCANDSMVWTDCWTPSGNTATCKSGFTNVCKTANSNDFATRPDRFTMSRTSGGSLNLLKSGETYDLSVHAYQYGTPNTDTPEYNQEMANLTLTMTKRMPNNDINASLNGTPSFPKPFNFVNGLSDANASITYDDVGRVNVEISDTDWAKIDAPDTSSSQRTITGEGEFTFIPYQFTGSNIKIIDARNGNYTYLSNDLNMSAKLDLTVTSENKQGAATKNFATGLYEFPINVTPDIVDSVRGSANNNDITNTAIGFMDGVYHLSWNNADTSKILKFNFARNASNPINPFEIAPTEVNISVNRIYSADGFSETIQNTALNQAGATNGTTGNAAFLYGRADAPDYRFSNNPGCGRIWYEFYTTNNPDPLIVTTFGTMPPLSDSPDLNWYKNTFHVAATDGNVTATTIPQISVSTTTGCMGIVTGGGYEKRGFTYDGSFGYPFRGTVQLNTNSWLNVSGNNFGVEFYKAGSWIGETTKAKTATDADAEKISNRRIMW